MMRKSILFIALIALLTFRIIAQQLIPLPEMLTVKAIQKTDEKASIANLDNAEHIYRVSANTFEDVLQTLFKDKLIRYFPDAFFTEKVREMNPHIVGKKIFEAGVFVVPKTFENEAEPRYGLRYGASEHWERSESEGDEHLQKLLASYPDAEKWEERKQMVRENILRQAQLEPLPQKNPLNPIYGKPRRFKGYTATNVALETVQGYWICGVMYQPAVSKDKTPAMLCPHGHFFNTRDTFLMTERGHYRPEHQTRCAMLARIGFTVFSYGMFAFGGEGSLQIPFHGNHTTPLALTMQLWNSMRVIDFLCSLESVDQSKIGITGASGGGWHSFMVTAVDPRICFSAPALMVASHFYGGCACESGWPVHQTHCGLNTNNAEIAALAAPRPQLLISINEDWTRTTPTSEFPYLKKIYGYYGSANNVENVHIPDEPHDYGYTKREAMYNFVTRVCGIDAQKFKDGQGRYIEKNITIENPDNMLSFGNGRILKGYYVMQPVKTRPMLPETDIHGGEDLVKALKKQQNY